MCARFSGFRRTQKRWKCRRYGRTVASATFRHACQNRTNQCTTAWTVPDSSCCARRAAGSISPSLTILLALRPSPFSHPNHSIAAVAPVGQADHRGAVAGAVEAGCPPRLAVIRRAPGQERVLGRVCRYPADARRFVTPFYADSDPPPNSSPPSSCPVEVERARVLATLHPAPEPDTVHPTRL